jgi:nitrogen regulatory protein PII
MKLVILITARLEKGLEVAEAWQKVGAPGLTIIRTHGLHRLQEEVREGSVELPRMVTSMAMAMAHIIDNVSERGEMILSVVDDDLVDKLEQAATDILGNLTEPYTGVMFVLPIERAVGVVPHHQQK